MIFLLEYDRRKGVLLRERAYVEDQMEQANVARLTAELDNDAFPSVEVIILRSRSREELVRTHGRYFKTLEELGRLS